MKKVLLALIFVTFYGCASKKNIPLEEIKPKKAEVHFIIDERVLMMRSAFNYAFDQEVADSVYRTVTKDYYYNVRKKYRPVKNHNLVKFIEDGDYAGADLPGIATCFEPETFKVKSNINYEILNKKFGKYPQKLDTLSVLLKDYYEKSKDINLTDIDLSKLNQGFVEDNLDEKFKEFFNLKLKHRTFVYIDPLNNYVATPINFLNTNPYNNFILVGYKTGVNEEQDIFNITYDKYRPSIINGMINSIIDPLYVKYTTPEFERDISDPNVNKSKHTIENLLNYAVTRLFNEYYNVEIPKYHSEFYSYFPSFQKAYDLIKDYNPKEKSNFEKVYQNAFNVLKADLYANKL